MVMRKNMSDQQFGAVLIPIPTFTFASGLSVTYKNLTSVLNELGRQTNDAGGISAFTIMLATIVVAVLVSGWVNQFSPTGAQLAFLIVMGFGTVIAGPILGLGLIGSGVIILLLVMIIVGYNILRFGG
jgi:hypothetical protein